MDGTLLDLRFDNQFWLEYVPVQYGRKHGIDLERSKKELYARYDSVKGTLAWYCMEYWSRELQLDIAALKVEVAHLISLRPYTVEFLQALKKAGKRLVLLTNAHSYSVEIKLSKTNIWAYLDRVIVSHDLGEPKESGRFWPLLQQYEPFNPSATLLVDDNIEVLRAARAHGMEHLLAISRPDTQGAKIENIEFNTIGDFCEILPQISSLGDRCERSV